MSKYVDRVDMPIMGTVSLMLYNRPELDADICIRGQKFNEDY